MKSKLITSLLIALPFSAIASDGHKTKLDYDNIQVSVGSGSLEGKDYSFSSLQSRFKVKASFNESFYGSVAFENGYGKKTSVFTSSEKKVELNVGYKYSVPFFVDTDLIAGVGSLTREIDIKDKANGYREMTSDSNMLGFIGVRSLVDPKIEAGAKLASLNNGDSKIETDLTYHWNDSVSISFEYNKTLSDIEQSNFQSMFNYSFF
jgi:hypothetical protein